MVRQAREPTLCYVVPDYGDGIALILSVPCSTSAFSPDLGGSLPSDRKKGSTADVAQVTRHNYITIFLIHWGPK